MLTLKNPLDNQQNPRLAGLRMYFTCFYNSPILTGMGTEFIHSQWKDAFTKAEASNELLVVCPFIQVKPARLLLRGAPGRIQVITRFNLNDFFEGVSSLAALRFLLSRGANIRGVKHLHSKLFIFDDTRSILTSANLTGCALNRNPEFGMLTDNPETLAAAKEYFRLIWSSTSRDLTSDVLDHWEAQINAITKAGGKKKQRKNLPDHGEDSGNSSNCMPASLQASFPEAERWFVKFFGTGHHRFPQSTQVIEEVRASGSHRCLSYGKRPRGVCDGDLAFISRLVSQPHDTMIYGRATCFAHQEGRDEATSEDIELREWKEQWPYYVRVRDPEFIASTLRDGVSLNELMDKFGSQSYETTARRAARGEINIRPQSSLRQQPAIFLTPEAASWLNQELEIRFREHGKLGIENDATLDWPSS